MAAVGYLLSLGGGAGELLKLVKMLYYADRLALECWHRTITGDAFYALDNGPIVSTTYDLMKGAGPRKYRQVWGTCISPRRGNVLTLLRMPDTGFLSENEKETLQLAFAKISPMKTGQLITWMHTFPEWNDPKGGSLHIDPKTVLKLVTPLTNEAISAIEEEVAQANYMDAQFGTPAFA
jgi:hypothetical protein